VGSRDTALNRPKPAAAWRPEHAAIGVRSTWSRCPCARRHDIEPGPAADSSTGEGTAARGAAWAYGAVPPLLGLRRWPRIVGVGDRGRLPSLSVASPRSQPRHGPVGDGGGGEGVPSFASAAMHATSTVRGPRLRSTANQSTNLRAAAVPWPAPAAWRAQPANLVSVAPREGRAIASSRRQPQSAVEVVGPLVEPRQ